MSLERTITLTAVWLLIAYEFVTYNILFVPGFLTTYPRLFAIVYPIFFTFVVMLCICYYKAIVTPPGSPSPLINHDYHDIEQIKIKAREEQAIKKDMRKNPHAVIGFDEIDALTRVSYCFKCDRIKPVRTHHCKICQKCIDRMDHHCPWVGNCVGRDNQKFFIQFLLYSSSALAIIFWTVFYDFFQEPGALSKQEEIPKLLAYVCGGSSGCLALSIGFLFVTQMLSLSRNLTTLEEYVEGITQRVPQQLIKVPWKKPSFSENVEEVTGDSSWLCPTTPFYKHQNYISVEL